MIEHNPFILIISGVRGDTRRYRSFHLFEQAQLAGLKVQMAHITDIDLQEKTELASVVILHRAMYTPLIARLIQQIHHNGGILIQDIDDLLFEPEMFRFIDSIDFADPLRASLYQEEMQMYRQTLEACDAVITSTEYLAQRIHRLGKPVNVHRNAFSLEMLDLSAQAYKKRRGMDERIVIGYASGTATHNQDFALIKPALINIMQKFANTELWLVGPVDPGKAWGSMGDRIHKVKKVPWRDLPAIQSQFDINLAPVRTDNPFSQSKSEIKFVEAALVRVPTIASPSDAFKHAIRKDFNGFLADSTKEWASTMERLIFEPGYRRQIGEIAFQDVLQYYHPFIRAGDLVKVLNSITGSKLPMPDLDLNIDPEAVQPTQPYWSSAQLEKTPSLLQMGRYTFRQRGFQVLLKQIRVYLRRWISPVIPYRRDW